MDIKVFKEKLASFDGGDELLAFFQSHDNTLREDIEKAKTKKGEAVTQKSELETVLSGLLGKLQASTADEATTKISSFEQQLTDALGQIGTLTESFEQSQAEKEKEQKEKEKALLLSGVIEAIANKKVDDEDGVLRDAMLYRSQKTEDGSGYLIDGKVGYAEFLQGQIDSKKANFQKTTHVEKPNFGGDIFTKDELSTLSREDYKANREKVERSKLALSN